MEVPVRYLGLRRFSWQHAGWLVLAGLVVLLWTPISRSLLVAWRHDERLSHGPLIPLLALGLLWMRRNQLREWRAASPAGLTLLVLMTLIHALSCWADVEFVKPVSLIGMMAGGIWFLGGAGALKLLIGALGLLVFMIPWPTTIFERIQFPMQMTSSAYAALLGGLLGLHIERDTVNLTIIPGQHEPYRVLVAEECSGLTSLLVLLTLAYLVAYHTPVGMGWRAALVAVVVPIGIVTNAIRILLILVAGGYHGPQLALWVHDHETPILVFLSSLALMGLRQAVLAWSPSAAAAAEGGAAVLMPPLKRFIEVGGGAPAPEENSVAQAPASHP